MGNCCMVASSMEWGGEDWGYVRSKHKVFDEDDHVLLKNVEKEKILDCLKASYDLNGRKRVRIMISKKELSELLGGKGKEKHGIGARHASAEEVMVRLINGKYDHVNHYYRPWRPVLQSIPEVN